MGEYYFGWYWWVVFVIILVVISSVIRAQRRRRRMEMMQATLIAQQQQRAPVQPAVIQPTPVIIGIGQQPQQGNNNIVYVKQPMNLNQPQQQQVTYVPVQQQPQSAPQYIVQPQQPQQPQPVVPTEYDPPPAY